MIVSAAGAHGVLVEAAIARLGFARVVNAGFCAGDGRDESTRERGDA